MMMLNKISISVVFFLLIFLTHPIQADAELLTIVVENNDDTIYYIIAPSGLNMRKNANAKSSKVGFVEYGEEVILLEVAKEQNMEIDQLKGGMAKVSYGGQEAYIFDAYLSPFPATGAAYETVEYVETIRSTDVEVLYETHTEDWGGWSSHEEAFSLTTDDWQLAYLLAQQHYEIPNELLFPGLKGKANEERIIKNPKGHEYAWEDQLVAKYDAKGNLENIEYNYRAEGGGTYIEISLSDNPNAVNMMRISQTGIAD